MPEVNTLDQQEGFDQTAATQDTGEVTTPESGGTTVTQNNEPQGSDQTAPSQDGEGIDYKTRWQSSSEEARRLFREKQELEKKYKQAEESILGFVMQDRQRLSDFLDSRGVSDDEKQRYLSAYDAQNGPQQRPQNPATQGRTLPRQADPLDPFRNQVLDDAAQKLKSQVEARQAATQRFLQDEGNRALSKETLNAIWPLAYKLETEDHLDPDSALARAKSIIVGQDEVESQNYYKGLSDALFGNTTAGVSGGAGGSKGVDRLPPEHEAFVQAEIANEGLKGKDAEAFRKRYIERLAAKRLI